MTSGKKTISNSLRPKIENIKNMIRFTENPFDGSGSPFKTAISELRAEGVNIIHDRKMCRYYNKSTINPKWGY